MTHTDPAFTERLKALTTRQHALLTRPNEIDPAHYDGIVNRWRHPVVTADHTPLYWRYDLNSKTNPLLIERLGINAAFNPGAIDLGGKILLVVRVEGRDRKSFFGVAESDNGVDNFRFWDYPILLDQTAEPDVNVYDMRLTQHEDGYIYGVFCTERKDPSAPRGDTSAAVAQCGIVRTKDLKTWTRLADVRSRSPQQRNVVLHPELVNGKYAFYTRPQDGFIDTGSGGGIGWGLSKSIENVDIEHEVVIDEKIYHTIKEVKNGQGPAPIKTERGWLHITHGVRACAAGLRYVLYLIVTDLMDPSKVIARPGGFFMAPQGEERFGDVSNVLFCNAAVARSNGEVFIYYASSDTRTHVATTSIERLVDYAFKTPEDPLLSHECVAQRQRLIKNNLELLETTGDELLKAARS